MFVFNNVPRLQPKPASPSFRFPRAGEGRVGGAPGTAGFADPISGLPGIGSLDAQVGKSRLGRCSITLGVLMTALWLTVLCGALAIVYAIWATRSVLAADSGNARMQEIAAAIREGAQAYLKRQYTTIGIVGIVIFLILGYFLGWLVALGFAIGAVLSGATGFIGMNISVRANVRTAQAAIGSLAAGLELAFKAGAITGMLVAGLALLGVTIYFWVLTRVLGYAPNSRTVVDALVALGFGASLISI